MDKIKGTRPTALFIDEHSSLVNVDFAKLEKLFENTIKDGEGFMQISLQDGQLHTEIIGKYGVVVPGAGDYRHYRHPQLDQFPRGTVTGRIHKDNPEFQELPGVHELHAKAWGELLHKQFDTPEARAMFKECTFLYRYSGHGLIPMKFRDVYEINPKGADHPSRKREPKGPRGKWGKPK